MIDPPSSLIERLRGRAVLVIGDLMLDHFVIGHVERISPEAPVPVVRFGHEEFRLGGAANVAHNVAALGGHAELVGLVGDDLEAERLRKDVAGVSVGCRGIVTARDRCTTRKLRVVTTRNQQVARIDYENDTEVSGEIEAAVIEQIDAIAGSVDAILVSDYLKGIVSRGVAAAAIAAGRRAGVPVLIDPKVPHVDYYRGATLVTPNHHEAEAVAHMRIRSGEEAREAAVRFRERAGCDSVLITRGEHGMWLHAPEGDTALDAEAREVADVTGAGDTVIGTMALGLAAGGTLFEAARLANRAAGIVVGKFGPATVSLDELRGGPKPEAASATSHQRGR
jgi:D-beta-D-heptose 7-phosphate kinase/D-beta-D-heptose 1-phosphate adenosyltransferase